MALRLRVVSDQRRALGDRATIVVGVGGTSIGRSADNDWVLPDPLRYVSGRHARIHFRQGAYYLEDTSTNGIFLNDSDLPLSRQGLYCLRNGDLLRLGEYQVVVTVEAGPTGGAQTPIAPQLPQPPQPTFEATAAISADGVEPSLEPSPGVLSAAPPAPRAVAPAAPVAPVAPVAPTAASDPASGDAAAESLIVNRVRASDTGETGRAHTDIGASLNLQALLDPNPSDSFRAVNAFGQAVAAPLGMRQPERDADSDAVARRIARLARAASRSRQPQPGNTPAFYDVQTGLNAFCRGAGVDASHLPADAQTRMLHLAGQLFRESLVGLRDLSRHHHDFRNRLRIESAPQDDPNRPSLERGGVEDLAEALLSSHDSRRIDAVQWLRECFDAAKRHDAASSAASNEAFAEFIGRLDPADLEARFGRSAARGRAVTAKADYWDLYAEFYRNLCEMPPDALPHVYVEAFARAYTELTRPKTEG